VKEKTSANLAPQAPATKTATARPLLPASIFSQLTSERALKDHLANDFRISCPISNNTTIKNIFLRLDATTGQLLIFISSCFKSGSEELKQLSDFLTQQRIYNRPIINRQSAQIGPQYFISIDSLSDIEKFERNHFHTTEETRRDIALCAYNTIPASFPYSYFQASLVSTLETEILSSFSREQRSSISISLTFYDQIRMQINDEVFPSLADIYQYTRKKGIEIHDNFWALLHRHSHLELNRQMHINDIIEREFVLDQLDKIESQHYKKIQNLRLFNHPSLQNELENWYILFLTKRNLPLHKRHFYLAPPNYDSLSIPAFLYPEFMAVTTTTTTTKNSSDQGTPWKLDGKENDEGVAPANKRARTTSGHMSLGFLCAAPSNAPNIPTDKLASRPGPRFRNAS